MNYLVEEIGALCKLRPQRVLGPVDPKISCEGLERGGATGGGRQKTMYTCPRKHHIMNREWEHGNNKIN